MTEELTQGRLKELLHYCPDTGVFTWAKRASKCVRIGDTAGSDSRGYVAVGVDSKLFLAHRLAFLYMTGEWPSQVVDHINGDRSDNRWANLRHATTAENAQNQRRAHHRNVTGLLGAHWYARKGKYVASIRVNGKQRHLGYFSTAQEAHAAYMAAKKELHPFSTIT